MKKALLSTLMLVLIGSGLFAQGKREEKMQEAINALMETEFIAKYQEYKALVETTALDFKTQSEYYDQAAVERIRFGYENSRMVFEKILDGIHKDLLQKSTRDYIAGNPERYTQFISTQLDLAMNSYQEQVVYKISELTGVETVGFGIMEIKLLLDLVFDVVAVIKSINKELDRMSEEYLNTHFTEPLRIASWEQLGS